jgi:hypothetical protein
LSFLRYGWPFKSYRGVKIPNFPKSGAVIGSTTQQEQKEPESLEAAIVIVLREVALTAPQTIQALCERFESLMDYISDAQVEQALRLMVGAGKLAHTEDGYIHTR